MKSLSILVFCIVLSIPAFSIEQSTFISGIKSMSSFCDRAFLGVYTSPVSKAKAQILGFDNPHGSYVTRVIESSAAASAGLVPFDYIVGINEDEVSGDEDLNELLMQYQPGDEAVIHFYRGEEKREVAVRFGKFWEVKPLLRLERKPFLGVKSVEDSDDVPGVVIEVIPETTAEEIGLVTGDRIQTINDHKMVDWADVQTAVGTFVAGDKIEVAFDRDGQRKKVSGILKSYLTTHREKWEQFAEKMEARAESYSGKAKNWAESEAGNGAFLGIHLEIISKEKAALLGFDNPYGSYVSKVLKNTAAEKAGIQPFDYIFGIDEYRVGMEQFLGHILAKYQPGDAVIVHLFRNGEKKKLQVTLGQKSDVIKVKESKCDHPFFGIRKIYSERSGKGVQVGIVENSTAEYIGMADGDIILEINGHPMIDWTDVGIAIDNMQPGETIHVKLVRNDKRMKKSGKLKTLGETKDCEEKEYSSIWNFDFDFDFENDNSFINSSPQSEPNQRSRDISNMKAELYVLSSTERNSLKENFNLDMPEDNNPGVQNLSLSPNPNRGMFILSFVAPQSGPTLIRVYNQAGRKIYDYDLGEFSGSFRDALDISQNGTGSYYLVIQQGNSILTRKIILRES